MSGVTYRCVHAKRCLGVTDDEEAAYEQVAWEDLAATIAAGNSTIASGLGGGARRRLRAGESAGVNLTFRAFECSEGATGRLCGLCMRGYVSAGKNGCRACKPAEVGTQLLIFMMILASVVVFFAVRSMTRDSGDNAFDDEGDGVDFDEMASGGRGSSALGPTRSLDRHAPTPGYPLTPKLHACVCTCTSGRFQSRRSDAKQGRREAGRDRE